MNRNNYFAFVVTDLVVTDLVVTIGFEFNLMYFKQNQSKQVTVESVVSQSSIKSY